MNNFLKTIIFLALYLFSYNAFAGDRTVISSSICGTGAGEICASGGAVASGTNNICDLNTQSANNCTSGFRFKESYSCAVAADTDCNNKCISACNKIKVFILNPGIADVSASTSSNSFTRSICNALRVVTGSAGKTFAAFAIIAVGIGFFSGKVSWGLMIGVAVGIAAMFGAPSVVAAISGQNTDMMCNIN